MAITLDGTTGITTPGLSLAIENFSTTGNTTLGDASTDTLNVGNGGLVKDSSGRVGIGIASPGSGQGMVQVAGSSQSWFKFYDSAAGWNFGTFYKANGTTALAYLGGGGSAISGGTVDDFVVRSEGNLLFATGGNTERARFDTSGNWGLGVTPSASSNLTNIEMPQGVQIGARKLSGYPQMYLSSNVSGDAYSPTYKINGYAVQYRIEASAGKHEWYTAPSGTAGNAITFTQAMTLDASGNFLVGTTSGGARVNVKAAGNGYTNGALALVGATSGTSYITNAGGSLYFSNNGSTDHMVLNSSGNLQTIATIGVGNATPSTSGAGITFPATQSASSNANTLDDYEEGLWTPFIQNSSGTESLAFTDAGYYTKIGNVVLLQMQIYNGAMSVINAANHIFIRNIPFSASYTVACAVFNTYPAAPVHIVDGTGTSMPLYLSSNAVDFTAFTRNGWGGSANITLRGQWMIYV